MNKFVNSVLFFHTFVCLIVVVVIGGDLPITFLRTTGSDVPYQQLIFTVLATIYLLIGGRRAAQQWMGIALIRKKEKYKWNVPSGQGRRNRAFFYLIMESVLFFAFGTAFYILTSSAFILSCALWVLSFNQMLYAVVGRQKNVFRMGITPSALVIVDRDVKVFYYSGLRKLSVHQDSIYFDYIKELVMDFPTNVIPEGKINEFKEILLSQVDLSKVYIDETFKDFRD